MSREILQKRAAFVAALIWAAMFAVLIVSAGADEPTAYDRAPSIEVGDEFDGADPGTSTIAESDETSDAGGTLAADLESVDFGDWLGEQAEG